MPGIVAFGRRWLIGSDDTIFIGVPNLVIYFPWVVWSGLEIYNWFFFGERSICDNTLLKDIAFAGFFCSVSIIVLLAIGFIYFSRKGTILQVEARLPCVVLFYAKALLNFLGLLLLILIVYVLCNDDFCGNVNVKQSFVVLTVAQSLMSLSQLLFWWLIFDDVGSLSKKETKKKSAETSFLFGSLPRKAVNKWKFRILSLFIWSTYPSRAKRDAIKTVSELLAYISQELDIVFTDFAAGILLMRQKHLAYYQEEKLKVKSSPAIALPDGSAVDCFPTTDMPQWMNLHLARRYFRIGLGVFGWRWTVYRNMACGICRLWNHIVCCFQCRKKSVVEGDNCCGCNLAGLHINSDVPYKDLIHVSFRNKVYVLPFFVSVDTHSSAIVISVRGTMSFNDVLTDLAAGIEPMEHSGCFENVLCHAGMLKAALRIRERLQDRGILDAAFEGRDGYHLVTTGHSLGASVAILLALLLRPSYPTLRCFAFEPPPCVSVNALEATFDFVFSIVFGNDVVPYLSFGNVERMVEEVVKCIEECNLPKYKVLFCSSPKSSHAAAIEKDEYEIGVLPSNGTKKDTSETIQVEANGSTAVENHISPEEKESAVAEELEADQETQNNGQIKIPINQLTKTEMYIPGKVLHVRYSKHGYRLQIRTAQEYRPLKIRPDMVINHFPQYVEGCLEQLGHTYTLLSVNV